MLILKTIVKNFFGNFGKNFGKNWKKNLSTQKIDLIKRLWFLNEAGYRYIHILNFEIITYKKITKNNGFSTTNIPPSQRFYIWNIGLSCYIWNSCLKRQIYVLRMKFRPKKWSQCIWSLFFPGQIAKFAILRFPQRSF